jgi:plasmid stabilization system protein ParE
MTIVLAPQAQADLRQAYRKIAEDNSEAAESSHVANSSVSNPTVGVLTRSRSSAYITRHDAHSSVRAPA